MPDTPTIIRVCEDHLREIFWAEDIKGRFERGELLEVEERSRNVQLPSSFLDYGGKLCVRSGELVLMDPRDPDVDVARLHYYLTDTGEIGASGEYDPKMLMIRGVMYRIRKTGGGSVRPCEICSGGYVHEVLR
jgi:hypothetical protein